MSVKKTTFGFGYKPEESQNHFYVVIPPKDVDQPIQIFERYEWTSEGLEEEELRQKAGLKGEEKLQKFAEDQVIAKADVLRLEMSRHKWSLVSKDLAAEFNGRLRDKKLPIGKFNIGGTPVERLFGKEMMVLLWGIEDCDPSNIPTAIRNWKGLMPEERWWLYTMTNAATGGLKDKRGWRSALRYALCENPVVEKKQVSMFENWEEGDLPK